MIKSELIEKLAAIITHLPKQEVTKSINTILKLMGNTLMKGKRIEIRGFGSFSSHYRLPHNAHNPKTGEKVLTKTKSSPHFKSGKRLRYRIDISRHKQSIREI